MEPKLKMLKVSKLCGSCGRKIRNGMNAFFLPATNLFYCNLECCNRDLGLDDDKDNEIDDN